MLLIAHVADAIGHFNEGKPQMVAELYKHTDISWDRDEVQKAFLGAFAREARIAQNDNDMKTFWEIYDCIAGRDGIASPKMFDEALCDAGVDVDMHRALSVVDTAA